MKEPGDSGVWAKSVNPMDLMITVVGRIKLPPQIHVLNPGNCVYVTLCGKKDLSNVNKEFEINYPGLSVGSVYSKRSLSVNNEAEELEKQRGQWKQS